MIANHITDLIGNTPLLRIAPEVHGLRNVDLYAKLEMMNPFGSVKDRIGWSMLKDEIAGIRERGAGIYESSSGNTAKALQTIASTYGIRTKLFSQRAKIRIVKQVLLLLGAEIEEISGASDCFDPGDPNDPHYIIEKAAKEAGGKIFFPSQYTNPNNPKIHYDTTAAEILADLGKVDYFFATLGTTGSSGGTTQRLREDNPGLVSIGLCAANGETIPGIRSLDQLWEVGLFRKDIYDDIKAVRLADALNSMMTLVRKCGVLCGPTSGAAYEGALAHLRDIDATLTQRKTAVFIVCDRMEWYVDYMREQRPDLFHEPVRENSLKSFSLPAGSSEWEVPVATAPKWIAEKNPLVIDTRGPLSFRMMTVAGAMNIPVENFEAMIDGHQPFPPGKPLLIICPTGEKSLLWAAYLRKMGAEAFSLQQGLVGWRNAGHPLEKGGQA